MRSRFKKYKLGTLITEISNRNNRNQIDRVYSVTNSEGFIQSTDYFDKEVFSKDISNYKIVKRYQFAYNPSRINVGSIAYLQEQDGVVVSPLYVVFSCTNALVPEYLLKFIKSPIGLTNVKNKTRGSVRESLNYKSLSDIEIPLPTVVEQLQIATILGKIELLIRRRKESIDLLNELLKSKFLQLFGNPVGNEMGWQEEQLGKYILDIVAGSSYEGQSKEKLEETELGVLKVSAVTWGTFNPKEFKAVRKELITKKIVQPAKGDFLFSRANTRELVGATCIVLEDYPELFLPDKIWKLVLDESKLDKYFLHFLLQNKSFKLKLTNEATGSSASMLNISMEKLRQLSCPIPPIKLQNKFAAIVEKTEILKAQFQNNLSNLEELYASLSQRAFKGELDLSAIETDETLLPDEQKGEPIITISPGLQKAIELSDKINKQFESIGKITKVTAGLTRQMEQWNKLQDQFQNIPKLPEAFLKAQKNIQRLQEAIGKAGTTKTPVEEETGFNWAVLANRIKERYKDRHFNFEMLHRFIQKDKLAEATPYYASEELKANPRLNDAEDLKSFIQSAIQNIEMDEKQQRQTNPFLRLTQSFYNAEVENFALSLHKEDFKLIKDKTARQRSGIYFSLATEA